MSPPLPDSSATLKPQGSSPLIPQLKKAEKAERKTLAYQRYREKNRALLREKSRLSMKSLRAERKLSGEAWQAQAEQHRAVDARYSESVRQRRYIDKYGLVSFQRIYKQVLDFHGAGHLSNIKVIDATTQYPPRRLVLGPEDEADREI
ncbi:hypothetical protein K438DRAFT_1984265 [Mycena galopus ATCC 62051]|nr:hypothetical protein K438DRAFT_1984265 [Mycena galopus ATCC 62051]